MIVVDCDFVFLLLILEGFIWIVFDKILLVEVDGWGLFSEDVDMLFFVKYLVNGCIFGVDLGIDNVDVDGRLFSVDVFFILIRVFGFCRRIYSFFCLVMVLIWGKFYLCFFLYVGVYICFLDILIKEKLFGNILGIRVVNILVIFDFIVYFLLLVIRLIVL